jgi:AbrB family looped-hinge helix DNA binding protein
MAFVKIGSKGQITIPLEVRRKLGLKPGDRIDFVLEKSGEVLLKAKKRPLTDLLGISQGAVKRPLGVEQMHDAVLQAADEDWARLCSQKD